MKSKSMKPDDIFKYTENTVFIKFNMNAAYHLNYF